MIRGFYTALSGMIAARERQEVVADSIANVNTPGYMAHTLGEADFTLSVQSTAGGPLGELGTGTYAADLALDTSAGGLQTTGRPTDLAVEGGGLFAVRTPQGTAYTRRGDFQLSLDGKLTDVHGNPVLDTTGRDVIVPVGPGTSFEVASDGTVIGTSQRIAVAAIPASGMTRLGDGLYELATTPPAATGIGVRQGLLEASNVDLPGAMTALLTLQRQFSLNSRALSMQSDTLQVMTDLGRLR